MDLFAFDTPLDGVETTPAPAVCRRAGNPTNSRPSFDGPSSAPPGRLGSSLRFTLARAVFSGGKPGHGPRKVQAIKTTSERGAMTRTGGRGIRILDGAETAVAAARVAVISATRSAFRRGPAQTAPRFSLCSSLLVPSGSYRQARSSPIIPLSTESVSGALRVLEGRSLGRFPQPRVRRLQLCVCAAPRPPRRGRLTPVDRTGCVPSIEQGRGP